MFESVKNWWNRDKIRQQAIDAKFDQLTARIEEEKSLRVQAEEEVQLFRAKDEADRARREGKEPWVEIKSADYSEVKGIQIELDWNDAFIQHLKENGIDEREEEAAVQKWLAYLYQDMIGRLEDRVIEANTTKQSINDFE